jgi:hypothetical protein
VIDLGLLKNTKEKMELVKNMREMGFSDEQISETILNAEKNEQENQ